ncbi:RNA helicase [Malassezia sp. CBS 17886]|nr:RNA helicase [Malassezia sp. CBS 17886]
MTDAEKKQRAKKERLEAWRREQAKKRANATDASDAPQKRARVDARPTLSSIGLRGRGTRAARPPRPLAALGDTDEEPVKTEARRFLGAALGAADGADTERADAAGGADTPRTQGTADEEDPLDAYMSSIATEVRQIGADDAQKGPYAESELLMQDADGDEESADELDGGLDLTNTRMEDILALAAKRSQKKDLPAVDHTAAQYEPFRKAFYQAPEEIASLAAADVERMRMEMDAIAVRGKDCPHPITKWSHCGVPVSCLDVIRELGYESPTPIQSQAVPAIMSGRDVIGVAKTGSGKTLAFLLPMLRHVKDQRFAESGDGPIALVMTPTRELAVQIYREAKPFLKALGLRGVCVYGGTPVSQQIAEMKRAAEFVVATPGRMIDLLAANNGRVTNLRRVTYLVLDEADRMFDMGFEPQVMKIVNNIQPARQTVLFSATFPKQMEGLARKVLQHQPLEIAVGGKSVVASEIRQVVEVRPESTKFHRLLEVLGQLYNQDEDARTLIFVERQEAADALLSELMRKGYPTMSLHGGKDQADRDSTIADFKAGIVPIVTATSVAARGLDVKQLKLVVNYDVPNHMEDYVHRAGRTGRAGNTGTCITFITPYQDRHARDIMAALKASKAEVPRELEALVAQFKTKLAKGTAHAKNSGFGGRGLSRLENDRERVLLLQQTSFADAQDESDVQAAERVRLTDDQAAQVHGLNVEVRSGAVPEALRENRYPGAADPVEDVNQARLEAARAAGADTSRLQGVLAHISAMSHTRREITTPLPTVEAARRVRDPDATAFHAIIPINDFPQKARWKVTNKEKIANLIELTGASITNKGAFYDKGKQPQAGEPPKLSLLIESNEEMRVEHAVREVKRLLLEGTQESLVTDSRAPTGGRYTVV